MKIEYPKPQEPEYMSENEKFILDACCWTRMSWFNKEHPNTVYMDFRELEETTGDGRRITVKPDVIGDFRHMPFADGTFRLVVFEPPPFRRAGQKPWANRKSGCLNPSIWKDEIRAGFQECFRVLIPCGILVFRWNEDRIPIRQVVPLAPERPLFGQKCGKTHWLVFVKPLFNHKPKGIQ